MYGKGCPHSQGKLFLQNTLLRRNLVSPEVLKEIEIIADRSSLVLKSDEDAKNILLYFEEWGKLDGKIIYYAFTKYCSGSMKIQDGDFPFYKNYSIKKGNSSDNEGSINQLMGFALSDIYNLSLLHINLGYSLAQIKGLLLRSMVSGIGEFEFTPIGIISQITGSDNPKKYIDSIGKILKKLIPQNNEAHSYGEPSCPFILSKEADIWLDTTILFLLEKFIPLMQEKFKDSTNFQEQFLSGNFEKNPL